MLLKLNWLDGAKTGRKICIGDAISTAGDAITAGRGLSNISVATMPYMKW
jgi:hypothetical protein